MTHNPCEINGGNIAEIVAAMPEGGRNYLAWLLSQGIVSYLDWHLKEGLARYKADQERLQQWADELDNRFEMGKAA